ncbi:hypothetical protein OSB04_000942 [Centaurea solstitialis]|uniref:Uncharacterized protein n=1 Tax=Centaurea solstitialis TaxID=347529 RepID=A0AA38U2R8_9ASTR|nr:hypothetical protein OSB04_000942 [Centaurea solstitialis]
MNPNKSGRGSRGRGSRGGGGLRGAVLGGAGPSGVPVGRIRRSVRRCGGSGFAGGPGFADYAQQQPYIPQFDAQPQPYIPQFDAQPQPYIPHFDEQNAGYGTGYPPNFFPPHFPLTDYPPNFFPTQFSHTAFPPHYGTSGFNTDYNRGNTGYPDFVPRDTGEGSDSSETHSYVPETQRFPTEGSAPDSPEAEPKARPSPRTNPRRSPQNQTNLPHPRDCKKMDTRGGSNVSPGVD